MSTGIDSAEDLHASKALMILQHQQRLANIGVTHVHDDGKSNSITAYGVVVPVENNKKMISTQVSGRIEKLYVKDVGTKISAGQKLYSLYSEELITMQQELLDVDPSTTQFESIKRKLLLKGVSENTIRKVVEARQVFYTLDFFATVNGFVETLSITEGNYVSENDHIFVLQDLADVWVESYMYPTEALGVSVGDNLEVSRSGFQSISTKVFSVDPRIVEGKNLICIRALVSNQNGGFTAGTKVQVLWKGHSTYTTIPASAVVYHGGIPMVFVKLDDFSFIPRKITVGREMGNEIEVLEGLNKNEKIVTRGTFLLFSEWLLKFGEHSVSTI
jgi:Cu(I)/Ag(I) efflux system membrane fusion protein